MATFSTTKLILAPSSLIPEMGKRISKSFEADGFEVSSMQLSNGGYDISISKGGLFKAVLGMKTALKISLTPQAGNVYFDAGVGVFGQQMIPTVISMFFYWPVLLTQIWGLIEQSNLDDRALEIAESVARQSASQSSSDAIYSANSSESTRFCPYCGKPIPEHAKFCPFCGAKIE